MKVGCPLQDSSQTIYQILVDLIIPRSPLLAYEYGVIQYYGALDLHIDEYLLLTRESLGFSVLLPLMQGFDINQIPDLLSEELNTEFPVIGTTMLGYYSEWFGYGTTRMNKPNERVFEFAPISWKQIGYPGPSLGYHALRPYQFIS